MEESGERLYRSTGKAILRATRKTIHSVPKEWPDLTGSDGSDELRSWLLDVWSKKETAEAITLASLSLARQVEEIGSGSPTTAKRVRRAAVAVIRYLLREARPTPFGLFAGVASARFGAPTKVRWGEHHSPLARVDTEWLSEVVTSLEACPALLDRLPVQANTLAFVRGDRLMLPRGSARVEIRHTSAVQVVRRAAVSPTRLSDVAAVLAEEFPTAPHTTISGLLGEMVAQQFLITALRPPGTVTDTLAYVIRQLDATGADELAPVAATVRELRAIQAEIEHHNQVGLDHRPGVRASVAQRMRGLSPTDRNPLAVNLHLDCDVELPYSVGHEMEAAATALLRLSANPGGPTAWREYYAAFLARYGTGTLVPVTELVNPDTGLGFPTGYPGARFIPPETPALPSDRDAKLLALVHEAAIGGNGEIILDEETIADLAAGNLHVRVPPHVEVNARIHATSQDALDRGEFMLTVSPARAAGTMTGRFAAASGELADVFANLPLGSADAIPAQVSVPPAYPHAENISRTPRFLPHTIALGEHRPPDDTVIGLEDLAVTADRHRLHLVSVSRSRVVEPQVFHGLALDKQPPPLARFLLNLPRGASAAYTRFDWGAAARLPYLPRVRYRRCVLSPAQWQIEATALPSVATDWAEWVDALRRWQRKWRMPDTVEMRDQDRVLRLDLTESAHAAILRTHLDRSGLAVLTETADPAGLGWLEGHPHEVAVPMAATRPPERSPLADGRKLVLIRSDHGHLPGGLRTRWIYAKIFVHPDRQDEILVCLPLLWRLIGGHPQWWFLRYRSPLEEHHLRVRIRVGGPASYGEYAAAVGTWAERLRDEGVIRRLEFDTYYPEVGRYGTGPVLAAAETVFATDSAALLTQWARIPTASADRRALAAASMMDTAVAFTGSVETGMKWIIDHPHESPETMIPRKVTDEAVTLGRPTENFAFLRQLPGGPALLSAWDERRTALATYRALLPATGNFDSVLESLLHMHHIRALGVERDSERVCRRLARAAALSWRTREEQR